MTTDQICNIYNIPKIRNYFMGQLPNSYKVSMKDFVNITVNAHGTMMDTKSRTFFNNATYENEFAWTTGLKNYFTRLDSIDITDKFLEERGLNPNEFKYYHAQKDCDDTSSLLIKTNKQMNNSTVRNQLRDRFFEGKGKELLDTIEEIEETMSNLNLIMTSIQQVDKKLRSLINNVEEAVEDKDKAIVIENYNELKKYFKEQIDLDIFKSLLKIQGTK